MASVTVDVDLDEFDTDELVQELIYRMNKYNKQSRKGLKDEQLKRIKDEFAELSDLIGQSEIIEHIPKIQTLDDLMKVEHIAKVFNKYNAAQFEQLIPE